MRKISGVLLLMVLTLTVLFVFSSMAWAADKIICVPWQGDALKYHTAFSGQPVKVKAVVKTDSTATRWYKWVFGDGTQTAVSTFSGSMKYNVAADHTYTAALGTPFTATLLVDNVDSSMSHAIMGNYLVKIEDTTLDAKANFAIDKGLWYLYTVAVTSGNPRTYNSTPFMAWEQTQHAHTFASPTASAIHAFAINNHKYYGDPDKDPYVEAVRLGMNFLVQGYYYYNNNASYSTLRAVAISPQHGGVDNPEAGQAAPNGYGIEVSPWSNRSIYEGGQIMDAIITSGVLPGDLTGRDFTRFNNTMGRDWTYGELLQDMADMYAYGQYDGSCSGGICGSWRYNWNDSIDNSASQWAAIGMLPAQASPWNVVVPPWVKTYMANMLTYSYANRKFGYQGPNSCAGDDCQQTTPCGMMQMAFIGQDISNTKWIGAQQFMADSWYSFLNANSSWNSAPKTYGWYSFAKAMRLALPEQVVTITKTSGQSFEWYRGGTNFTNDANYNKGLAQRIVEIQKADGHWDGNLTDDPLTTAWMVITLRPSLFQAAPIACLTAHPNPSYADQPIIFDPSCSGHSETGKTIANLKLFEWDWNNDGLYDESSTTPSVTTRSFSCATLPCTYPVTLRVTDDATPPLTATVKMDINITNPPHPPVAKAGGPYVASQCGNDSLALDGSKSYDPDEGEHEAGCPSCPNDTITAWGWDLVPPLTEFRDKSGKMLTLSSSDIGNYFQAPGLYDIGLRVTDNTKAAFPTSGQPDLQDANFGKVQLYGSCGMCNLAARPKSGKIQLTWAPQTGATYDVYRSTAGPNTGFAKIAGNVVTTYATYLDASVVNGTTYYYRVVTNAGCGSNAASAKPAGR